MAQKPKRVENLNFRTINTNGRAVVIRKGSEYDKEYQTSKDQMLKSRAKTDKTARDRDVTRRAGELYGSAGAVGLALHRANKAKKAKKK